MMAHRFKGSPLPMLIVVLAIVVVGLLLFMLMANWNSEASDLTYYTLPEPAQDVVVVGNYAYVTTGDRRLRLVDIANPTAELGFYDSSEPFTDVAVAGHYAYIAAGGSGLRVLDVANPAAPVEVYHTARPAQGVAVTGHYAYVATGDSGLRVLDVANPAAPVEVGVYDEPLGRLYATGVLVVSNRAYLGNRIGNMLVVDISNPTAPRKAGSIPDVRNPAIAPAYGFRLGEQRLAVAGNSAFFLIGGGCGDPCAPNALLVVDIANPAASLGVIGGYSWESPEHFSDIAVAGNYAYIASGNDGLRVIDVTNPAAPAEVVPTTHWDRPRGSPWQATMSISLMGITGWPCCGALARVPDPSRPQQRRLLRPPEIQVRSLTLTTVLSF